MKEILYVTAVYTGTLIGAGFATGKEVQEFFKTPISILFAFLLFLIINLRLFTYINKNNIYTYSELLEQKCPAIKNFVKFLSGIFSLLSFGIMCNGAGEALNFYGGGLLFSIICCVIFLFEMKGVTFLNIIAAPLIVIGIILIAGAKTTTFAQESFEAIKYCSYNTLCCLPVIPSLNIYLKDVKSAKTAAITVSATVAVLISLVYYALPEYVCTLPLLETARMVNLSFIYYPALLLAMLTTAVSSGYGYMCCYEQKKYTNIAVLLVVACVMQRISFGALIKYVFGFFGLASLGILYFLLKKS